VTAGKPRKRSRSTADGRPEVEMREFQSVERLSWASEYQDRIRMLDYRRKDGCLGHVKTGVGPWILSDR
jgi:hypothetical protein